MGCSLGLLVAQLSLPGLEISEPLYQDVKVDSLGFS